MKFSIIVPVYNVENYILKCLESIFNQTYKNYEVIIVNDGSSDNSEKIIKQFIKNKNNFKYYYKDNGGLSDARNFGIEYTTGDYLLFVDSDDFLEIGLLEEINNMLLKTKYDVIRYELKKIDENNKIIYKPKMPIKNAKTKYKTIKSIIKGEYMVDPSCLYVYNVNFWKVNNFKFAKGKIHEDYGLTPIILSKAHNIGWLNYIGYNYVQRDNSIMAQVDYKKILKRVADVKEQYLNHINVIKPSNKVNRLLLGFSSEILILKGSELKDEDRIEFIDFIKKEKVINKIYSYSIKKFLKKLYLYLFLEKYIVKLNKEFLEVKE